MRWSDENKQARNMTFMKIHPLQVKRLLNTCMHNEVGLKTVPSL